MKLFVNNYLMVLDLYGLPIPLYFKNKSQYKTHFGAIISILSLVIILTFIIILSKELFEKTSFTIVSDLQSKIDLYNIPILFYLTNSNSVPIPFDDKLYSFSAVDNHYLVTTENGTKNLITNHTSLLKLLTVIILTQLYILYLIFLKLLIYHSTCALFQGKISQCTEDSEIWIMVSKDFEFTQIQ